MKSNIGNEPKVLGGSYVLRFRKFFCFAPARVKVKHNDYDPIGTWRKYGLKGPQNVKRSAAEHFAMMAVWPP